MSRGRPVWVRPSTIAPPDFLRDVEKVAKTLKSQAGTTGHHLDGTNNPNIRVSTVKFIDPYEHVDINRFVYDAVHRVNAEFFGFDITATQVMQHTTYKKGHHYKPHVDVFWETDENTPQFDRKLSVSILLNDPSEFEGGDLVIDGHQIDLQKGEMVIFPSYIFHEVLPVKKGIRKSLVAWIWGQRWR